MKELNPIHAFILAEYFYTWIPKPKYNGTDYLGMFNTYSTSYKNLEKILSIDYDVIRKELLDKKEYNISIKKANSHNQKLKDRFNKDYIGMLKCFGADLYKSKGTLKNVYNHMLDDFNRKYHNYITINEHLPSNLRIVNENNINGYDNIINLNYLSTTDAKLWKETIISQINNIKSFAYSSQKKLSRCVEYCIKNGINFDEVSKMSIDEFMILLSEEHIIASKENYEFLKTKFKFSGCSCGVYVAGEKQCSCGSTLVDVKYTHEYSFNILTFSEAINSRDYKNVPKVIPIIKKC